MDNSSGDAEANLVDTNQTFEREMREKKVHSMNFNPRQERRECVRTRRENVRLSIEFVWFVVAQLLRVPDKMYGMQTQCLSIEYFSCACVQSESRKWNSTKTSTALLVATAFKFITSNWIVTQRNVHRIMLIVLPVPETKNSLFVRTHKVWLLLCLGLTHLSSLSKLNLLLKCVVIRRAIFVLSFLLNSFFSTSFNTQSNNVELSRRQLISSWAKPYLRR